MAKKVGLKSGVYGRVERGMMMPSVPTLRRMCETLGISSDVLLSLGALAREETAPAPVPAAGEHPELSRIIHILQRWPPERLGLLRKLLETADTHLIPAQMDPWHCGAARHVADKGELLLTRMA